MHGAFQTALQRGQGGLVFLNLNTDAIMSAYSFNDVSCEAVYHCFTDTDDAYSGPLCDLDTDRRQGLQALRVALISNLLLLTRTESADESNYLQLGIGIVLSRREGGGTTRGTYRDHSNGERDFQYSSALRGALSLQGLSFLAMNAASRCFSMS